MDLHPHLYADDTQIYGFCAPDEASALQQRTSTCVTQASEWMKVNRLQLNTAKSEQLWCTSPRQQNRLSNIALHVGCDVVQPVRCVWNLGIFIDSDVSMKTHISKNVSSCFAALRWLRLVMGSAKNTVPTGRTGFLLSQQQGAFISRWRASLEVCVYALYKSTIDINIDIDIHWTDEAESRHRLRSGSCPRLIVPRTRLSTISDRSFRVTVARAWNSLPTSITALTSLPSFNLKKNIFIYQIFPISLIFLFVICVPWPRSYCSLCHVNLYVLLLLLLLLQAFWNYCVIHASVTLMSTESAEDKKIIAQKVCHNCYY